MSVLEDGEPAARPVKSVLLSTAVIVAALGLIGALLENWIGSDDTPCRIATDFLMDDMKDERVIDTQTAVQLRELYVAMARQHCAGE